MTQEDKKLLLKDLCARLPYGVKVGTGGIGKTVDSITIKPDYIEIVIKGTYAYSHFIHKDTGEWDKYNDLSRCKPYLRPMSSMTEEEKKEMHEKFSPTGTAIYKEEGISTPLNHYGDWIPYEYMSRIIGWLNAHHFDYRGLIEKGLALEAPEGMYNEN